MNYPGLAAISYPNANSALHTIPMKEGLEDPVSSMRRRENHILFSSKGRGEWGRVSTIDLVPRRPW